MADCFKHVLLLLLLLIHFTTQSRSNRNRINVDRGLNDAKTVVGQLFTYTIPKDAFDGDIERFEATEAGGPSLQKWLIWDPETTTLTGVPTEQDVGPNYVQVSAIGTSSHPSQAAAIGKDIFSVHVYDEGRLPRGAETENVTDRRLVCQEEGANEIPAEQPSIIFSLVIGSDGGGSTVGEKIELLRKAADVFHVDDVNSLRIFAGDDYALSQQKRIILLAGETDKNMLQSTQNAPTTVLMWKLNCGSSISEKSRFFVDDVEKKEKDGQLNQIVGKDHPIVGWYVASTVFERQRRRRRSDDVQSNANFGHTGGPTGAVDTSTTAVPTSRSSPRTSTTRVIRPTGFVTTGGVSTTERQSSTTKIRPSTISRKTTTRRMTTTTPMTTEAVTTPVTRKPHDKDPKLEHGLGTKYCYRKMVCYIPIPDDTFSDEEDGDTSRLALSLAASGDTNLNHDWLRLDAAKRILIGISPNADNEYRYLLTATDSGNRPASNTVIVKISESSMSDDNITHTFEIRYESGVDSDVINFLQKMAAYLGENNMTRIRVNSTAVLPDNSRKITWSNTTWDQCKMSKVDDAAKLLKEKAFESFMAPDFKVKKENVKLQYGAYCRDRSAKTTAVHVTPTMPTVNGTATTVAGVAAQTDNFFISTILPAIIIVVFLIVAALVACLLYRRNRKTKGRMELKNEFISKGAPVIFPDEVDADKESTAATPMLLKDEKPPLQPLDFSSPRSNGNGSALPNAPIVGRSPHTPKAHVIAIRTPGRSPNMEETELIDRPLLRSDLDENPPLYRPPPPFESSVKENRSPRPKHASPQQREPPPYVPP